MTSTAHSICDGRRRRPSPATVIALIAQVVASTGVASGAIPSATDGTITACYDREAGLADNKKGTLRVIDPDAGQACNSAKENTLTWKDGSTLLGRNDKAADADKLDGLDSSGFARFAGAVKFDGTFVEGTGFTVDKGETGEYTIRFPAGTFEGCRFPIVTVTPFLSTGGVVANVSGRVCFGDGGASFSVRVETLSGTPRDTTFMFLAA
jgi:hypothetical protein